MKKEKQENEAATEVSNVPETETKEQTTATVNNNAPNLEGGTISMTNEKFLMFMQNMMEMFSKGMSAQNAKGKRDELNGYARENSAFREGIRKRARRLEVFTVRWKRQGDHLLLKPYLNGKEDCTNDFYFTFSRTDSKYNLYIHKKNKGQFNREQETDIGVIRTNLAGNPKYITENIVSIPLLNGDPVELARMAFLYFNGAYGNANRIFIDTSKGYTEL